MANVQITTLETSTTNGKDSYYVTVAISGHKNPLNVYVSYNEDGSFYGCNIAVNNASQKAYNGIGRWIWSLEEARNTYKAKRNEAVNVAIDAIEELRAPVEEEEAVVAEVIIEATTGTLNDTETLPGSYPTFEVANQAIKATDSWNNNSSLKINIKIVFTNDDSHSFRYDVSNWENSPEISLNGIVDIRARLIMWTEYVGSERWEVLLPSSTTEEDKTYHINHAANLKLWVANTPVQEAVEATVSEDQPQTSYSYQIVEENVQDTPVSIETAATAYTYWNTSTTYYA